MAKNPFEGAALPLRVRFFANPNSGRKVRLRMLASASLIVLTLVFAPFRVSPDLHTGYLVVNHAFADDGGGGEA